MNTNSNRLTADYADTADKGIDPELSYLGRFFAWLGVPAPHVAGPVLVRVAYRAPVGGYYSYTIEPANDAARELLGATDNGSFATPADARRRAAWNCWEVVD